MTYQSLCPLAGPRLPHGLLPASFVQQQGWAPLLKFCQPRPRPGGRTHASKGGSPFGSSKRGGGKGANKKADTPLVQRPNIGSKSGKPKAAAPPKQEIYLTGPFTVSLLDELSNTENVEAPRWDTFCNHLSGEWVGQYGAYTPWEGKSEPVWLDDKGKYINTVYSRCVEHMLSDPSQANGVINPSSLVRKIGRATTLDKLKVLQVPHDGVEVDGDKIDLEALSFNSEGVVIFNGGNYSAGPEFIGRQDIKVLDQETLNSPDAEDATPDDQLTEGSTEDDDEGEDSSVSPTTSTVVFESCLVDWGSKTRTRAKVTVRIGHLENGEVDVEVMRMLVFREEWIGMPGVSACAISGKESVLQRSCIELPRVPIQQVQGTWNVFTVSATAVEETDPLTQETNLNWVYFGNEDRQQWDVTPGLPSGDEGAAWWLPGNTIVTLRMVENLVGAQGERTDGAQGEDEGDESEGDGLPRGLCLGFMWGMSDGQMVGVEREYDGAGYLREVRQLTAVRGGWSGGRM